MIRPARPVHPRRAAPLLLLALLAARASVCLAGVPAPREDSWEAEIRARIAASEYHFSRREEGSFAAPNRSLDLRITVDRGGTVLASRTSPGALRVRIGLEALGRVRPRGTGPASRMSAEAGMVRMDRDGITEWWDNARGRLEHGFLVHERPAGPTGPVILVLGVRVDGGRLPLTSSAPVVILGGDRRPLLTYDHLEVVDADGRRLPSGMSAAAGRIEIRYDDEAAIYPVRIDPIVGRPPWVRSGDHDGEEFASSISAIRDLDGDGYADILVGAPGFDGARGSEGAVFLFAGSPAGLAVRPGATWHGRHEGQRLGRSVAVVGDVNGDGRVDLLLGSRGSVELYPGSFDGFPRQPAWSASDPSGAEGFGEAVAAAGDVNADGYDDILVGAPAVGGDPPGGGAIHLFYGSPEGLSGSPGWSALGDQPGSCFGCSLSPAGDVNGDGFADFLVGAGSWDGASRDEGAALLFVGGPAFPTQAWRAAGGQEGGAFGTSLAGVGDLDGDGYSDLAIGAPFQDGRHLDEGRLLVFMGSAHGPRPEPDWEAAGEQPGARLGMAVAGAGDTDDDGFDDLLVGAPGFDGGGMNQGRALLYAGSPAGLRPRPVWSVQGSPFQRVGWRVGGGGDVDGDGRDDMLVGSRGAPGGPPQAGSLRLHTAARGALDALPAWTVDGGQQEALLGTFVSSAGDVDGDGYDDVLVGAMFFDNGEVDEGKVFLFRGSASGLSTVASWTAEGDQESAAFGASLSSAGDVNDDGFDDVLIAAYLHDGGEENEGRLYLYLGSSRGPGADPAWTWEPDQPFARIGVSGGSVASAGDVNGDGFADIIAGAAGYDAGQEDEGRAFVFLGSATGLQGTPAWIGESDQAGARYGASVAGAGDVNGDGFDDVIVGAPAFDGGQNNEGQVFLYLGSPSGPGRFSAWTAQSQQAKALYGASVSGAGDLDGDGFDDFVIGAPAFDDPLPGAGRADVYLGSADGPSSLPQWTATGRQAGAFFGISVAGAGDVDGDGFDDLLVGARFYDEDLADEGAAFLFLGGSEGLSRSPAWRAVGGQRGATFGSVVNRAGDVNGDGLDDIIIGARYHDSTRADEGRARVYLGSAALRRRNAP